MCQDAGISLRVEFSNKKNLVEVNDDTINKTPEYNFTRCGLKDGKIGN